MTTVHDFTLTTIDGTEKSLADYAGKVLLMVNVASKCGLTPHYKGLEELYRAHKEQGLVVLGFPCNDFGAQEPGSEEEIKTFCSTSYDVTFPMFKKLAVLGDHKAPLYAHLTSQDTKPKGAGDITWNFEKFVVGKDGQVVARFDPRTTPDDGGLVDALKTALYA
jgi:glutathione peroxidase